MHYGPPLLRWLVGRWNIDLVDFITKIITVVVAFIISHHLHGSITCLLLFSLAHSPPRSAPLWTEDPFPLPHLSFSASFKTCLFPLLSLQTGDSPCLSSALLAISQSLSLQKVITHWAHQPRVHSLHPHWLMSLSMAAAAAVVAAVWGGEGWGGVGDWGCRRADSFFWAETY